MVPPSVKFVVIQLPSPPRSAWWSGPSWTIADHSEPLLSVRSTIVFHCSNDTQSGKRFPFRLKLNALPGHLCWRASLSPASSESRSRRPLQPFIGTGIRIRKQDLQDWFFDQTWPQNEMCLSVLNATKFYSSELGSFGIFKPIASSVNSSLHKKHGNFMWMLGDVDGLTLGFEFCVGFLCLWSVRGVCRMPLRIGGSQVINERDVCILDIYIYIYIDRYIYIYMWRLI